MKKFLTLLLIVFLACIIASAYGVIHDQLTYTISPEYYTKFKFPMFGLDYDGSSSNIRILVALTGIIATWWAGLIIGIMIGLIALIFNNWKDMFKYAVRGIGITMIITVIIGFFGLSYGWLTSNNSDDLTFYMFDLPTIKDPVAFYIVGCIHNFSYIGSGLGLIIAIAYNLRTKKINKHL